MKYCRFCGEQIADEAVLCVHCGRQLELPVQPAQKNNGLNILCLMGFIFSFIAAVVGLILSIVGYNQVKTTEDNTSKNLAKAGIIISSVMLGLSILAIIFVATLWVFIVIGLIAVGGF